MVLLNTVTRNIKKYFLGIALCALVLAGMSAHPAVADDPIGPKVLITELKLGGGDAVGNPPTKEFVTLFNLTSEPVLLDGWWLEHAKAGSAPACHAADAWSIAKELSGTLAPGQVLSLNYQLNDNAAGALRVRQVAEDTAVIHDLVGWGAQAPCSQDQPAAIPPSGKSIQRYVTCQATQPVTTQNNVADFTVSDTPSYGLLSGPQLPECAVEPPENPPPETPQPTCQGVIMSEILPNPSGTDTGKEFIELHNPTNQTITLNGCTLQTSASDTTYQINDAQLQPGEYKAWYSSETGLTLLNSGGGTVWLLSAANELQAIVYPGGLADDVAWAMAVNNQWQETYTPTPNAQNSFTEHKPCPADQERSPTTGRCRNVSATATLAGLAPCPTGQQRNPQTNRCRAVNTAVAGLQPCAPNQYRNPETNRCKKVDEDQGLKPCQEGYERNPQTNRCRKVAPVAGAGTIHDIPPSAGGSMAGWWLAGAGVVGALGYGVYEWRQEIARMLASLKSKFVATGATDEG